MTPYESLGEAVLNVRKIQVAQRYNADAEKHQDNQRGNRRVRAGTTGLAGPTDKIPGNRGHDKQGERDDRSARGTGQDTGAQEQRSKEEQTGRRRFAEGARTAVPGADGCGDGEGRKHVKIGPS